LQAVLNLAYKHVNMKITAQQEHTFYEYQREDIETIFSALQSGPSKKLVYQLPTGGGKTVIFSEIARRFVNQFNKKVAILTHRKELGTQTSAILTRTGVNNKIINSSTKNLKADSDCYVAMVETLRNRIKSKKISTRGVGLVIIDEAHHNSFRKLLGHFKEAFVIGVTATPFSSDVSKPMNRHYESIITGKDIPTLIDEGFLAKPESFVYDVELNSLKTGLHGDYTVSSSNELYGSPAMLSLLLEAYNSHSNGKKTLIFNNGIDTSIKVRDVFEAAGIPVKHLDNTTPPDTRKEILKWFRKTKNGVLTSVSILTTGFDEPTVATVILNRATTSITLYHQMIGRGARVLPTKKTFRIIDLGNNIQRFGEWQQPIDWNFVFKNPEAYAQQLHYQSNEGAAVQSHALSAELRAKFPNTLEMTFDVERHYQEAIDLDKKPKTVIQQSIRQQTKMCIDNSETLSEALSLAGLLLPEIQWRVKQYVKCLDNASKNYKEWLIEDYQSRLQGLIKKLYPKT